MDAATEASRRRTDLTTDDPLGPASGIDHAFFLDRLSANIYRSDHQLTKTLRNYDCGEERYAPKMASWFSGCRICQPISPAGSEESI